MTKVNEKNYISDKDLLPRNDLSKLTEHRKRWLAKTNLEPSRTDPSFATELDINNIMDRYQKTGIIPQANQPLQYMDTTSFTSFQEAQNTVLQAQQKFAQYPAELRAAMQNDPAQATQFLSDPKNYDLLKKHGLLTEEKIIQNIHSKPQKSDDTVVTKGSKKPVATPSEDI